jgi:lamin tail-like protein/CotH protein
MIKSFLLAGMAVSGAFALSLRAEQVVISEIMYNPRDNPPEYIEVYNNTATPFDIVQWRLTGGASYEFPAFDPANPQASFLKPFERIVLSGADEATTRASYSIPASIRIFGPWVGNLGNDGERITLQDKNAVIVCTVQYNDRGKWSPAADGAGHSLVLRSPNRLVDDWRNWTVSNQPGGTPGDGTQPAQDSLAGLVKLNEIHFSSSNTVDWVELYNITNAVLALDGLFLSARRDFADRMPLNGSLGAKAFVTWNASFPLDDSGVTIYLVNSSNSVLDSRVFTQVIGRSLLQAFPDGSPEWYSSPTDTRNAANNPPRNTDIVINEIMFDPPSDQLDGEFIELHNRGASAVDVSGWSFSDGPNFTLPPGTTIPAGGYLVCAANAPRMRAIYGNIPVTGDFEGRLSNRGELIRLVDQFGNRVDEVDYRFGGDWPDLTQGNGSSMELVNPGMDNSLPSAWRDSDESNKGQFKTYTVTDTYRQLNTLGGATDYKELHFHLAGDGYVILQNIALRQNGTGPNLIDNGAVQSTNGSGASGWLCQGTHWGSFLSNGQLHLISDGHGDNKANRVEIDVTNLVANTSVTLSFDARWVSGTPRLIAQTWDHSVGSALRLEVPENLGTPGASNSRFQAADPPQVDRLSHSPAVPRSTDDVKVTARVVSLSPISSVQLFHRIDNVNANGAWSSKPMFDDGVNGGDALAGDGIYTATLTEHKVNGRIVQFYVRAAAQNGQSSQLPKRGPGRPAMYVVDDRAIARDLRTARFVVSAYDLDAIANGGVSKHSYRFPRLSNSYKNMTFISNEDEIFYGGEIRNSGSPWTRGGDLSRGKWKLPEDRRFRGHQKFYYDNDPTAGRMHHNRITRYWLYLLGHPVNENEFIRVIVNNGSASIREDTEPLGNDLLDRLFENGSNGELYRIDDEWWFADNWSTRNNRNADWSYKSSENPVRYHSEWMKRTMEDDYDYSALINLFRTTSSPSTYTQAQIERLVDAEAVLKMSAVRGYIGDWDSFTLNRGKNGYLYRRWSDGKFMFMHWDSDLAFQSTSEVLYNTGRPGIGSYISKPYNLRRFYYYLTELLENYTGNSARIDAWLQAEEDASSAFTVNSSQYYSWFSGRLGFCQTRMGANSTLPLQIGDNGGSDFTTNANTISLTGQAPYAVFEIEVPGHPEAAMVWNNQNTWTISGILLRSGVNILKVRGVDQWGNAVREVTITVTKTGSTPPRMSLQADPNSWNVAVDQALTLDARDSLDPEGTPLSYAWTPPALLANFDTNQPGQAVATFLRPGLYNFAVQGTDGEGQPASITREASVYGSGGFSSFGSVRLEAFWNLRNADYRWNHPGGAWFSLSDVPGWLVMQVLDDSARAITDPAAPYPFVWRLLPTSSDWVLQTKVRLASRQFGNYLTGLQIETIESGATNRYVFGIENGNALAAKRIDALGNAAALISGVFELDESVLRMRRSGDNLIFEQKTNEIWNTLLTQPLAAGVTTEKGGLILATSLAQSIRVHFDYAMLIDPSNTSELRENLRISEIMYNPVGGDNFEYIELMNIGPTALDLAGVSFTNGITFTFGPTILGAGQRIVIVKDLASFAARYDTNGVNIASGGFTGRLDNGGERLTLVDGQGNVILSFSYGDSGGWPERADGSGSSLEAINARGDYDDPGNWNSSAEYLGTPGRASVGPIVSVAINEVLSHTDPPLEDAVELYNPTTNAIDISGWYLSDESAVLKKFRIPNNTVIQPGAYAVFYEAQLNAPANGMNAFTFDSAHGDEAWLTAADAAGNLTFFVDNVAFGASENGVSFGRYPNGLGPVVTLSQRSFGADNPASLEQFRGGVGAVNAYPKVGPIVINQIMYNPVPGGDEFIELVNITSNDVLLYDAAYPTNTWKLADAVDYLFPSSAVLPANGKLLVVPTDPAAFQAKYNVPFEVQVFGPWIGALDNNGESIELYKPDPPQTLPPDAGFVPYLLVDKVRYNDREPWPTLADGLGPALQRRVPANFGDDPANWFTDFDADSVPDDWEVAYLFSPFYAGDADLDFDSDGFTNREEFINGTNPRIAEGLLQIVSVRREGDNLAFDFDAAANQTYSVVYSDDLTGGVWLKLMDVASDPFPRTIQVSDSLTANGSARFYRIVTPQQP